MVKNKMKTNKNGPRRMKRDFKRTKKKRKYERKIIELNKKPAIEDSKSEILNILDVENHKLSNIQQNFRGI